MNKRIISVVSPVYNSEQLINLLVERTEKALSQVTTNYEIILVDDGSIDNSWEKIESISKNNAQIIGIKLSRNFGQHAAIIAGLDHTSGEWVVVMDCDLQDQPEEIILMYQNALTGFDAVVGLRAQRQDGFIKKIFSLVFSKVFNYLSDVRVDNKVANFGVYNRKVINAVLSIGDKIKSFPLFVYWSGFRVNYIEVRHAERLAGKSSYNFTKSMKLALESIISYSNKPLKIFIRFGLIISIVSFILGINMIYRFITGSVTVVGYTSIIVSIWFFSGILITMLGIIGIYLGKVFDQTKNRPIYIIDKKINT